MSFWPFRRSSRRNKSTGPQAVASGTKTGRPQSRPASPNPSPPAHRVRRKLSKKNSQRRRPSSRQAALERAGEELHSPLAPIPPMSPFASNVFERPGSHEDITALPVSRELKTSPHLRPAVQDHADIPYNFRLHSSHSNIPPPRHGKLQRNPSRNKRAAVDSPVPKRRSTKKRKDEHVREEEIRAMAAPIPIPKQSWNGGILRRESKQMRNGMNRRFGRPMSDVSLPIEDDIHSSMSGYSECLNYRVTMMDIFAPRPTLRLSFNTPYVSTGMSHNTWISPSRSDSRRGRRPAPSKEVMKESRTIDALADDLDASELREIMERDKRRRERKKKADAEKLQRKLERRAERQRRKELREPETGQPESAGAIPKETEVKDSAGLGIQPRPRRETESSTQSAALDRSRTKDTTGTKHSDTYMGYSSHEEIPRMPLLSSDGDPESRAETPFEMQLDDESVATERPPTKFRTEDISPPASPVRLESGAGTITASETLSQPSSLLQSYSSFASTPPPSAPRRESQTKRGMFSSLFRRDPNRRKASPDSEKVTPSPQQSFTNISRNRMANQRPPAHLYQAPSSSRSRSETPVRRTQSKFREDLPELPLSPPDSRMQSPEVPDTGAKAIAARGGYERLQNIQTDGVTHSHRTSSPFEDPAKFRTDSPVSGRGSNLMSQSLASVDSEGSWFSGKPVNRLSSRSRMRHQSGTSSIARAAEDASTSHEELGIHDDEYFKRFTPQAGEVQRASGLSNVIGHKASSNAIAPGSAGSDTEEEQSSATQRAEGDTVVHVGPSRHPTVHHRDLHVKSSEGLLNQYIESGEDLTVTPTESPVRASRESSVDEEVSPIDEDSEAPKPTVERATSVNLSKGHVRSLSAGSAKLLDIPKRHSQQTEPDSRHASISGPPEVPEVPEAAKL